MAHPRAGAGHHGRSARCRCRALGPCPSDVPADPQGLSVTGAWRQCRLAARCMRSEAGAGALTDAWRPDTQLASAGTGARCGHVSHSLCHLFQGSRGHCSAQLSRRMAHAAGGAKATGWRSVGGDGRAIRRHASEAAFSTAFKRIMGRSPRQRANTGRQVSPDQLLPATL